MFSIDMQITNSLNKPNQVLTIKDIEVLKEEIWTLLKDKKEENND